MDSRLKYQVSYGRKVQTRPYENVTVSLQHEFHVGDDPDEAFQQVSDQVEKWLDQRLNGIYAREHDEHS